MDKLKDLTDITEEAVAEAEAEVEAEAKEKKESFDKSKILVRRPVFDFYKMGIPKGAVLHFEKDPSIHVTVIDNRQVEYDGKPQAFSWITARLLKSRAEYAHPAPYWSYDGKNLRVIYNETYPSV